MQVDWRDKQIWKSPCGINIHSLKPNHAENDTVMFKTFASGHELMFWSKSRPLSCHCTVVTFLLSVDYKAQNTTDTQAKKKFFFTLPDPEYLGDLHTWEVEDFNHLETLRSQEVGNWHVSFNCLPTLRSLVNLCSGLKRSQTDQRETNESWKTSRSRMFVCAHTLFKVGSLLVFIFSCLFTVALSFISAPIWSAFI